MEKIIQVTNSLQQLLLDSLTKAKIIIKLPNDKVIQFNLELPVLAQLIVWTYRSGNFKLPLAPKEWR